MPISQVFCRLQSKKIILNNEGVKLEVLKNSCLTLAEIHANDYNFGQLTEYVCTENHQEDTFLLLLSTQQLACGGMVLIFSFNHFLCDANAACLFIADFASQVKNSTFKFDQSEVRIKVPSTIK